ncbi:hypothetical protein [Burkholderia sp. IDO3]|uniref:hypothetical protein n=1 Tax=Burkholderia sp. IDO3 TaxID=1705310 RepID=UPI0013B44535|nr:hypothetical protein [Burkholderia sp. IDO3]
MFDVSGDGMTGTGKQHRRRFHRRAHRRESSRIASEPNLPRTPRGLKSTASRASGAQLREARTNRSLFDPFE